MLTNKLMKQVKKLQAIWNAKTPKQKWQTIVSVPTRMLDMIGMRLFSDMKVYWFSYSGGLLLLLYVIMVSYTVCYHLLRGESLRGLECTYTAGTVSVVFRLYWKSIGPERYELNNIATFSGKYIFTDDKQPSMYNTLCEKMIQQLVKLTLSMAIVIIITHAIFAIVPLYLIIFKQIRITPMCLEMPFFESDSNIGYAVNLGIQSVFGIASVYALLAIQVQLCLAVNAMLSVPNLIHLEIKDLEHEYHENHIYLRARIRIRNIIMRVQDFIEFTRGQIDLLYVESIEGPCLTVYSISFSIFGLFANDFPAGYGLVAGNYILLLILCSMGELLKHSKERIESELYNMKWYMLPLSCQNHLVCAIHMIQHGPTAQMGPFGELNMETATMLTIKIFRFTIFLLNIYK